LDELFHQTLFAGAKRSSLHQLILERSGHLERIRRLHLPEKVKIVSILDGHHAIIDAIAARVRIRIGCEAAANFRFQCN
ncbi:FCD domain-containing protein, partial [Rhizobium ruizarguesonis]